MNEVVREPGWPVTVVVEMSLKEILTATRASAGRSKSTGSENTDLAARNHNLASAVKLKFRVGGGIDFAFACAPFFSSECEVRRTDRHIVRPKEVGETDAQTLAANACVDK